VDFDGGLAKIVQDNGSTKTIEITPSKLGPVDVLVQIVYADNTLARQTAHLNVVPSATGLKKFQLNQGFPVLRLAVYGDEVERQRWLFPVVTYQGVKLPIYLEDSSQIKLSVEQNEGNPAISVDKNGLVKAVREGTATLTGDFAGVTDKIQITVQNYPTP